MKNLLTVLFLTIGLFTYAQEQPHGIVVNGEGITKVTPDQVLIKVKVEHDGTAAEEVKSETDNDINNVLQFLKKKGIEDKYIQTEYIRLDKRFDYNTKTYKYYANQSISIKLIHIKDYESIISGLLKSGINGIDGIQFLASNMEKYESEARIKAIKDAKQKANEYAAALGQKVGKAIFVTESGGNSIQPVYKTMMMNAEAAPSANKQTIAIGEMEVTASVTVTFALYE